METHGNGKKKDEDNWEIEMRKKKNHLKWREEQRKETEKASKRGKKKKLELPI